MNPAGRGRKRKMKRFAAVLMSLVMACVLFAGAATAESFTGIFEEWDPDAPALNALIEYVEDVTDEDSRTIFRR